jgi:hypothetical protein
MTNVKSGKCKFCGERTSITESELRDIAIVKKPCLLFESKKVTKAMEKAIYARLREFGKSFWIARFIPWVHPYNNVKNCFALTLDGGVYYKFQFMALKGKKGYYFRFRVAETPKGTCFTMDVKKNQRLSYDKLISKIGTAKVN